MEGRLKLVFGHTFRKACLRDGGAKDVVVEVTAFCPEGDDGPACRDCMEAVKANAARVLRALLRRAEG